MNTRKKVVKTVYIDEDDSEGGKGAGDFSDSGSDAKISDVDHYSSEDEPVSDASAEEFVEKPSKKSFSKPKPVRKTKFAKDFISKIQKQTSIENEDDVAPAFFSVKDLTDADKLLPPVLNLSDSDSSDDESPKPSNKQSAVSPVAKRNSNSDSEEETNNEYKDVWSSNIQDNSEEVAKRTFMELEQHKTKIEETKASLLNYSAKSGNEGEFDVNVLLAQGEEVSKPSAVTKGKKRKKVKDDSDSDMEDWEEVKDAKPIPQQGLQLIVDFPDAVCKKTKKLDVEMMMKRKINRVKKEYQVYMHKVHVLCWIGHGNYVSRVLNDQEILAATLSFVPSKSCYPGERVDMKYVEQITTWFKDKLTVKHDKNEDKFRPKAPPLKYILLAQLKTRVVTNTKYLVFVFVSMLRALGLQCRVMFNFVTLPIKPPSTELCSLSTKPKDGKADEQEKDTKIKSKGKGKKSKTTGKTKPKGIPQVDGADDMDDSSDDEYQNIVQIDGNDDRLTDKPVRTRSLRTKKSVTVTSSDKVAPSERGIKSPSPKTEEPIESPPKKPRRSLSPRNVKKSTTEKKSENKKHISESPMKSRSTSLRTMKSSATEKKSEIPITLPEKRKRVTRATNVIETEASKKNSVAKEDLLNSAQNKSKKKQVHNHNNEKDEIVTVDTLKSSLRTTKAKTATKNSNKPNGLHIEENKSISDTVVNKAPDKNNTEPPKIIVTDENNSLVESKYFENTNSVKSSDQRKVSSQVKRLSLSRKKSPNMAKETVEEKNEVETMSRAKSADAKKSKYFDSNTEPESSAKKRRLSRKSKKDDTSEDAQRVSHKDLLIKAKPKNDVTGDLINIVKKSIRQEKEESKKCLVKGKAKLESDDDSDYMPVVSPKGGGTDSDDDFKLSKISPRIRPSTSAKGRKIDRRVISSDEDTPKNKTDVWCEIFVEELEQWIAVDVIRGKVHCASEIYKNATHPVCYIVGWDNNNYLKDLTRRYVPQWNTVTRKQRAEPAWWNKAVQPWLGPKSPRDREEDDQLNRMQLDAPLPTSIGEYKNHPLYALKRHLLKFEAIYPSDAAVLGFVRKEPVYARECVYVCRSRDTWLKEAKVVRLGETPYKVVKARPKWDRLSNKLITDKPLEVFGPWQVQEYEPPVAENGVVPRNAYGNVELFKACMLPKGTVHVKLPGLNRVCKKLNIDCAPAMTGFDFNGGWSHPVYDGFVVCQEFEEIVTQAWLEDQEEQERKELEKLETRVYGNWKRLIKGLLIRERVKLKYGFEDPAPSAQSKKKKGPRFLSKKK